MNNKLVIALLSACFPFILIIAAEWLYGQQARESALHPKTKADKHAVPTEMPSIDLSLQPEESYEQLVSRPLFMKGRRPVLESTAEQDQADILQANFDWQLDGIYSSPKGRYALLSRVKTKKPKDNFRKLTLGGNLEGWQLEEIGSNQVVFSVNGEKKQLMLKKPKPKATPRPENNADSPPTDPAAPDSIVAPPQIQPDAEPPIDGLTEDSPVNAPNE